MEAFASSFSDDPWLLQWILFSLYSVSSLWNYSLSLEKLYKTIKWVLVLACLFVCVLCWWSCNGRRSSQAGALALHCDFYPAWGLSTVLIFTEVLTAGTPTDYCRFIWVLEITRWCAHLQKPIVMPFYKLISHFTSIDLCIVFWDKGKAPLLFFVK